MTDSIITAPTLYVMVGNTRFSYRRFGKPRQTPVLFLQHFTGTMDTWDPLVVDGIAKTYEVIIFNNRGIGSSEGITPDNVQEMANDVLLFMEAIGLKKVNLLSYSLGGFIAQLILKNNPGLLNKIILIGTGPKGGTGMGEFKKFTEHAFSLSGIEIYLFIFYTQSEKSRQIGLEVFKRLQTRAIDRDPDTTMAAIKAQTVAIMRWSLSDKSENNFLSEVSHPVLIVNGSNDAMFDTVNSYDLFRMLPNAQLSLYPDAAHGSLFQHAALFVEQAIYFFQEN